MESFGCNANLHIQSALTSLLSCACMMNERRRPNGTQKHAHAGDPECYAGAVGGLDPTCRPPAGRDCVNIDICRPLVEQHKTSALNQRFEGVVTKHLHDLTSKGATCEGAGSTEACASLRIRGALRPVHRVSPRMARSSQAVLAAALRS